MRANPIFIILLILVLGYAGYESYFPTQKANPPGYENYVGKVDPQKLIEEYQSRYRLPPDRRFIKAIGLLNNFFRGENVNESAIPTWQDGRWDITYAGKTLGQLPEFPDYSDYMKVLTDWAKTLSQSYPLSIEPDGTIDSTIETSLNNFFAEDVAGALFLIDKSWREGHHSEKLLESASRGLTYLAIQNLDSMGIGDDVPAQAWAILAAYNSLTGKTLLQEEVLLADHLSYSDTAKRLSSGLPSNDLVRSYIQRESMFLSPISDQNLIKFLHLKNLVKTQETEELVQYISKQLPKQANSLAVMKIMIDTNNFAFYRTISNIIPDIILQNLSDITGTSTDPGVDELFLGVLAESLSIDDNSETLRALRRSFEIDKSGKVNRFNKQLNLAKEKAQGPFLTSSYIDKFYESFFFSGLYAEGTFYLDRLASLEMVHRFNQEINDGEGETMVMFKQWYQILMTSQFGNADFDDITNTIAQFKDLSPSQFKRLLNEIKGLASYGDPRLNVLMRRLCQKLDSRPGNMISLGTYAYTTLLDLPLAEKLITRALEISSLDNGANQVWLAYFQRDIEKLKELSKANSILPADRAFAFKLLSKISGIENVIGDLKNLQQSFSSDFQITNQYIELLMQSRNYPAARTAAQAWIDQNKMNLGLDVTVMAEEIAQSYLEEGLYQEGFDYIKPYIDGQKGNTFKVAVNLLNKLGRRDEAAEILQIAMQRYPQNNDFLCLKLEMLWEEERYEEAAKLIANWKYPLNFTDWRWKIGTTFNKVFSSKSTAYGTKAFTHLVQAGLHIDSLVNVPKEVNKNGNHELAFMTNSLLNVSGLQALELLTFSYSYRKDWTGEVEANKWLKQIVPAKARNPLSMFLFADKHYDQLWEFNENPGSEYGGEFVWLLRAAAWVDDNRKNEVYHNKLVAYYRKHKDNFYERLGRYLLDMETAQNVINAAEADQDKLCEYSYYFGIKAQRDGDIEKASDWYHVTVGTGLQKEGEYRWAFYRLWDWMTKEQSLSHR